MARPRIMASALTAAVLLAGCTATAEHPVAANASTCNADPAQARLGQPASADLGAELLRLTGARVLRWAAPRTAMTMDFRADRLTVAYDDAMIVTRISCG